MFEEYKWYDVLSQSSVLRRVQDFEGEHIMSIMCGVMSGYVSFSFDCPIMS